MTFGIFSVLVSQIYVLESYLDICFKDDRAFGLLHQDFFQILVLCLPLVPVVKILKKIGVTGKIWEKAGVKLLRDLT